MPSAKQDSSMWQIVIISGLTTFIIFGIRLSFAVFFTEFVNVEGWSNESAATIFSASMLVFAFGSTPSGILLDKFGPRIVFTMGVLLLALGLFLSSMVNTVEQLTVTYGIIGGAGLALVGLGPIAANISAWFPPAQRGRAIGIAFAGTGFGSLIFVPLCTWLIDTIGWRSSYIVLSLICLLILAPLLLMIMRKPIREEEPVKLANAGAKLIRSPIFWLLMLVSLTALGPLRSLTVHQLAYIESVGVERQVGANYIGLSGFLTAGTFIMWGWFSDRFGRALTFTLGALSLSAAVGILFLLPFVPQTILILYAVLYALGEGTRSSQTTALASDVFQNSGLGLVNGLVGAMFGLGAAFGPWLVGRLRDNNGDYISGFMAILIMIAISIAGFIGIVIYTRYHKSKKDSH